MIDTGIWWLFLALTPVVYWMVPQRFRSTTIAVASLGVLLLFSPWELPIMVGLGVLVYFGHRLDPVTTPFLAQSVARSTFFVWAILLYLFYNKYLPAIGMVIAGNGSFFSIAVPLGLSYFCFKLLHYEIEMRRGNIERHSFDDFLSWLFLAPIFTAGPIERFDHFLRHREIVTFSWVFVAEGLHRIAQGLVKKFFFGWIVLRLQQQISGGALELAQATSVGPLEIWAYLSLAVLYLYLDFSAYSDIAIGSSRLFGYRIMENFNLPMLARNLPEFWQRWHMSLAQWCRFYIYIPMIGLTRNPYFAGICTFAVMGIWHAASLHWLLWGLWHGTGMALWVYWSRWSKARKFNPFTSPVGTLVSWAMTMAFISLGGAFTMMHGRGPIDLSFGLILRAFGF